MILSDIARKAGSPFLRSFHVRLRDLREGDDDSCKSEDGHGDQHCRGCILYRGVVKRTADKVAKKDRGNRAADGVAGTSKLDETVACVSATAETVEHRVHDDVEHAHRETGDEGADYIDGKTLCRA